MLNYQIKVVDTKHEKYFNQCKELAKENHVDNGGTVKDANLVDFANYIVCAVQDEKVVGFVALKPKVYGKYDVHIMQIVVKRELSDENLQNELFEYVLHHSMNFETVNIKDLSFLNNEEEFISKYSIKRVRRYNLKLYYTWTKDVLLTFSDDEREIEKVW